MSPRPWLGAWAGLAAPVGPVLADMQWWVVLCVLLLVLVNRIFPRASKDLLILWLRIIPPRNNRPKKRKTDTEDE